MPAIRGSSRIFPVGGASSVTGPRGISGPTGATGATGPVGDTGPLGVTGTYIVATGASGGPGNSYGNDFITFFLADGTTIGVSGAAGNVGNAQSINTSYRIVNDSEALEHGQLRKLIDGSTAEFYSFTISGKDISARYEGDTIIFHGATYDFGVLGNTGEFVVGVSADGAKNTHYDGDTLLMRILNHREIFDSANDNANDDITTKPILTDTIGNPNKIHGTSIPFLKKQNPSGDDDIDTPGTPGNTAFHSGLYLGQTSDNEGNSAGVYYEFPGVTFSGDYGDGNVVGAFGSCCYCSDGDEGEESHTKDCINYVTEEYCNTVDGIFSSLECLKSGCFDSGSCCVNGDCVSSTEETCEKYGGFYIDNLTCSEVNDIGGCPASCGFGGACCVGGVCIDADELACDFENGVYFPDTSCASIVPEFNGTPLEGTTYTEFCCDQECRGACCLEEICYDTTAVQCAALINENAGAEGEAQGESKGVFWGVGSVCAGPDGPYLWNNDPLERNGWFQATVEIDGLDTPCVYSACACDCSAPGSEYNPYGLGAGSLGYIDYILNETNGCLPPQGPEQPECGKNGDCDPGFCCDDGVCVDDPDACGPGGFDCRDEGVGCNCTTECCNEVTGLCDSGPCPCSDDDDCDPDNNCCCINNTCGECPLPCECTFNEDCENWESDGCDGPFCVNGICKEGQSGESGSCCLWCNEFDLVACAVLGENPDYSASNQPVCIPSGGTDPNGDPYVGGEQQCLNLGGHWSGEGMPMCGENGTCMRGACIISNAPQSTICRPNRGGCNGCYNTIKPHCRFTEKKVAQRLIELYEAPLAEGGIPTIFGIADNYAWNPQKCCEGESCGIDLPVSEGFVEDGGGTVGPNGCFPWRSNTIVGSFGPNHWLADYFPVDLEIEWSNFLPYSFSLTRNACGQSKCLQWSEGEYDPLCSPDHPQYPYGWENLCYDGAGRGYGDRTGGDGSFWQKRGKPCWKCFAQCHCASRFQDPDCPYNFLTPRAGGTTIAYYCLDPSDDNDCGVSDTDSCNTFNISYNGSAETEADCYYVCNPDNEDCTGKRTEGRFCAEGAFDPLTNNCMNNDDGSSNVINPNGWQWWETDFSDNVCNGDCVFDINCNQGGHGNCFCIDGTCQSVGEDQTGICCKAGYDPRHQTYESDQYRSACAWWDWRVSNGALWGGAGDWVCEGPPPVYCGCVEGGCENEDCVDEFGRCNNTCVATNCEFDSTGVLGGRCGWLQAWTYGTNSYCDQQYDWCDGCWVCALGGSGFAGDEQQYPEQRNFNVAGNDEPQPPQIPSGGESGCGTIILADGTCWSCCSDSDYTGSPDGCCCVNGESTVQNEDTCTGNGGYFYPVQNTNECSDVDFCLGACCKDNIIDAEVTFCCTPGADDQSSSSQGGVFSCTDLGNIGDNITSWTIAIDGTEQEAGTCDNDEEIQWCYYNPSSGYSFTKQSYQHCLDTPDDCPWIGDDNITLVWSQSADMCEDVDTDPNIESCCYCGNSPAPTADEYYRYSDCPGFDRIECVNEQVDEDCIGGIFNRDEVCEEIRCDDPFAQKGACCSGPLTDPPFQCYVADSQEECEGVSGETGNKWGGEGTRCCVETCVTQGDGGPCCNRPEDAELCGEGYIPPVPGCFYDDFGVLVECREVPLGECQSNPNCVISGHPGDTCDTVNCDIQTCENDVNGTPQCLLPNSEGVLKCVPACLVYNDADPGTWDEPGALKYIGVNQQAQDSGYMCPKLCTGEACFGDGNSVGFGEYYVCPCTELVSTGGENCQQNDTCEPEDYRCPVITCTPTDALILTCGPICQCPTLENGSWTGECDPSCPDGSCPPCTTPDAARLKCIGGGDVPCVPKCILSSDSSLPYCPQCENPECLGQGDMGDGRLVCDPVPRCDVPDEEGDDDDSSGGTGMPPLKWGGESTCTNCIELWEMGACCEQDVDEGQYSRQDYTGGETMSCSCCMDLPLTDCCTWWSDEIEGCIPPTDDLPEDHPVGYCPHCAVGCEDTEFCNSDDFCKIDTEVSTDEYNSCSHYCHSIGGRFYGDEFSTDCSSCGNWQLRPDTDGGWCCYRNEVTLQNECRKVNSPYECECTVQNGGFGGVFHKTQDECNGKCRQDSLRGSCCTLTDCQDDVDITDCIGSWKLNTPCYYRDCDITQRNFINTCTVDTTYRTAAECDKSVNPNLTFNYGKAIEIYDVADGGDTPNLSNNTAPLVPHGCVEGICTPKCCESGQSGDGCDYDSDCGGTGVCCNGVCRSSCEGESCSSSDQCGGLECCNGVCQENCDGSGCNRDGDCGFGCCVNGKCESRGNCDGSECRSNDECAGSLLCCEGTCQSNCCENVECSPDPPYTCGRCTDLPCVKGQCLDIGACCSCAVTDGVSCEETTSEECQDREGLWWAGKLCTDTVYENFGRTIREYCIEEDPERIGLGDCSPPGGCPCSLYLGPQSAACSDCFCCIQCGTDGICPDPERGFACEGGDPNIDDTGTCCIPCQYDWWGDDAPETCGNAFIACANAGGVITGGRCEDGCSNGTKCCDILNGIGFPAGCISTQCDNVSIPCQDSTYCPGGCSCLKGFCDCGK